MSELIFCPSRQVLVETLARLQADPGVVSVSLETSHRNALRVERSEIPAERVELLDDEPTPVAPPVEPVVEQVPVVVDPAGDDEDESDEVVADDESNEDWYDFVSNATRDELRSLAAEHNIDVDIPDKGSLSKVRKTILAAGDQS